MKSVSLSGALLLGVAALLATGCDNAPGRPGPKPDVIRPEEVLDFATLYGQNCAGCHGSFGKNGAAISLANPSYLAVSSVDNIRATVTHGVKGKLMPHFARSDGGMLTDQQIEVLAQGIVHTWAQPEKFAGVTLPTYAGTGTGNAADGEKVFGSHCSRCHGNDGAGATVTIAGVTQTNGSLIDPSYLAIVSDQYLRSNIIAGRPGDGMPDWRGDASAGIKATPLTDQEITDLVAWLTSHRTAAPGQPYPQQR
jgi:cytochrome c oxidase cbb3-type subunit 3/ubiquinol-cytochrome c reductase cytochrome c subunit